MSIQVKHYTAIDLLNQLLEGNKTSTIIVSRAAILAIIKQIQKEYNLTQRSDE